MSPLRLRMAVGVLCVSASLITPSRPASAEVPDDLRAGLTGRGHALLIGVSKYEGNAWPELRSVPASLDDLARGLAPHFATVETLSNPTTDELRRTLRAFMTGRWNQREERLLIYYAGHGFSDQNPQTYAYTGYITGRDTPACQGADCDAAIGNAIPFDDIDGLNRQSRVRQVINLFDSCFSGLAVTRSGDNDTPVRYVLDRAREQLRAPVRYYITAGGPTERIPADSPFATLVLRGLSGGANSADSYGDGFVTGEQLGYYLERNVPVYAKRPLHPKKAAIVEGTARLSSGQFLFLTGLAPPLPPNAAVPADPVKQAIEQASAAYVRGDLADAARLYRFAADRGNALGQASLGIFYRDGLGGMPRDEIEALRLFRLAAAQNDPTGWLNLGYFHELGLGGLTKNEREAARLYRLAADQGEATAQVNLAILYSSGRGGLTKDERQAGLLFRRAADQGNAAAQSRLGYAHEQGLGGLRKDELEAARLYRLAADQGDPLGQANLGVYYREGRAGFARDEREAVRLFRLAADQGDAQGQIALGYCYEQGLGGLVKNPREAARLYRLAADQGNAKGQNNVGVFYRDGLGGLPKDEREAVRLFRLSADLGDPDGQGNLGYCYEQGLGGLTANGTEAIRLYRLAARGGNEWAQGVLRGRGERW